MCKPIELNEMRKHKCPLTLNLSTGTRCKNVRTRSILIIIFFNLSIKFIICGFWRQRCHLLYANTHQHTPYGIQKDLNNSSELFCPKGACAIVKCTAPRRTCTYHKEEITKHCHIYIEIWPIYELSWVNERDLSHMVPRFCTFCTNVLSC